MLKILTIALKITKKYNIHNASKTYNNLKKVCYSPESGRKRIKKAKIAKIEIC